MGVNNCLNSLEQDIEDHKLTQRKKLRDGRFINIFSRNPRDNSGKFSYNCNLCKASNLPESRLSFHIFEKNHQYRLKPSFMMDSKDFKSAMTSPTSKSLR